MAGWVSACSDDCDDDHDEPCEERLPIRDGWRWSRFPGSNILALRDPAGEAHGQAQLLGGWWWAGSKSSAQLRFVTEVGARKHVEGIVIRP